MGLSPSLDIKFESLDTPKNMIKKANANVWRVMPKVSTDTGSDSPGSVESGGVTLGSSVLPSSTIGKLRKKRKSKNKQKVKRKKSRK